MELGEIINKLENQLKEEKNKNYNLIEKNNTLDKKIKELQSKINQQNNLENEINILNTKLKEENKNNADLHSGTTTWLNENDWDKRTVDKYVKNCNKFPQKNRLKIKY